MVALWRGKIQLFSIVFGGVKKEKKIVEGIGLEPMSQVSKTCMIDRYTNLLRKNKELVGGGGCIVDVTLYMTA